MQRSTTAVLAALLVIGTLVAAPVGMAQQPETETNQPDGNDTVAPGERLSGVVGVGEAELSGDIDERAYGIRIARANSSEEKAAVVADQLDRSRQRVAELEDRRQDLREARENGSISEGQYRARVATLHAESKSVAQLANQTNETASGLPAETLEANGVNATAIQSLQDRAGNLTGPETAEIARSIAGDRAGAQSEAAGNRTAGDDRRGSDRAGGDRAGSSDTANTTSGDSTAPSDEETTTDGETAAENTTASGSAGERTTATSGSN